MPSKLILMTDFGLTPISNNSIFGLTPLGVYIVHNEKIQKK